MKFRATIDTATSKRLLTDAIEATETELYGLLLKLGIEPESFDKDTFEPAEDSLSEQDVTRLTNKLSFLESKLKALD